MKNFLKKYPVAVAAIALTIILTTVWLIRHSKVADIDAALANKNGEAQKQNLNIGRYAQLEDQLKALEEANREISDRLVNPQDLAINLQYFYKLEAETSVKLLDTRPAGTTAKQQSFKSGYKTVQYSVSLEGGFIQVLTFLRRLEQGAVYCRVVSATCGSKPDESAEKKEQSRVNLSLTIELLGKA